MIESVLAARGVTVKTKFAIKTAIAAIVIALAVALPQIVHATAGASGGMRFLPMYLPVLLGACLLGTKWGLAVGVLSPVLSFAFTVGTGNAMPAAMRLPYMAAELAVFAAISGAFSKKIAENAVYAFPATLFAAIGGRIVFLMIAAIFQTVAPISAAMAWTQIQNGFIGLIIAAVAVPLAVVGIKLVTDRIEEKDAD